MIGKSVPRVDAYDKVTGRAKFADDMAPANCLIAKVCHAKIGNGMVKSIDTSKAEALDGVVKVVTFNDVPNHCYPDTRTSLVCRDCTSGCGRPQYSDRPSPVITEMTLRR